MNSSHEDDEDGLRYAEYVLGVLESDARAVVAHEVAISDEAAAAVALWQKRLTPLAEALPEIEPSEVVWARIRQAVGLNSPRGHTRSASFWNDARPWRRISAGAVLVAAVCIAMLLRTPVLQKGGGGHVALMVSTLRQDDGVADWTATMDLDRRQIVVVPAAAATIPGGRSTQLWLIPAGQAPISVGVFKPDAAAVLPLSTVLLARLGPTAALAVSVEPAGGSPTGQPTGPVIAKGTISGAAGSAVSG